MENETKQVLVIRKELKMRKGKIAAQASHASMAAILNKAIFTENGFAINYNDFGIHSEAVKDWLENIFTKITVSVNSEEELLEIYNKAKEAGLPCSLIQDAGKTEFKGVPTFTAVAIGPAAKDECDKITSHLPLL